MQQHNELDEKIITEYANKLYPIIFQYKNREELIRNVFSNIHQFKGEYNIISVHLEYLRLLLNVHPNFFNELIKKGHNIYEGRFFYDLTYKDKIEFTDAKWPKFNYSIIGDDLKFQQLIDETIKLIPDIHNYKLFMKAIVSKMFGMELKGEEISKVGQWTDFWKSIKIEHDKKDKQKEGLKELFASAIEFGILSLLEGKIHLINLKKKCEHGELVIKQKKEWHDLLEKQKFERIEMQKIHTAELAAHPYDESEFYKNSKSEKSHLKLKLFSGMSSSSDGTSWECSNNSISASRKTTPK